MRFIISALVVAAMAFNAIAGGGSVEPQKAAPGNSLDAGIHVWGVGTFEPKKASVLRSVPKKLSAGLSISTPPKTVKRRCDFDADGVILRDDEMYLSITGQVFPVKFEGDSVDNSNRVIDPKDGIDSFGNRPRLSYVLAAKNIRKKVRFLGRLERSHVVIYAVDPSPSANADMRHMFLRMVGKVAVKKGDDGEVVAVTCDVGYDNIPLPFRKPGNEDFVKMHGRPIISEACLETSGSHVKFNVISLRAADVPDEVPLPEDDGENEDGVGSKDVRNIMNPSIIEMTVLSGN